MKVDKSAAVALLVSIGFAKASSWDDERLAERIGQVPRKAKAEDIEDEHKELFNRLSERTADDAVELIGAEEEKPAKAKKEKKEKPAKEEAPEKPTKAKKEKPAKAEKPAKPEKPAKEKKAPTAAAKVERDEMGCKVGTISADVNRAILKLAAKDWADSAKLIELSGRTKNEALGRLYYGAEKGIFETRHLIQYRLAPDWKKKLASGKGE